MNLDQPTETIRMNKYHFDDIYKITDYNVSSYKIQRFDSKQSNGVSTIYLPKSECNIEHYHNGVTMLNIPLWLINKHQQFFKR